MQSGPRVDVEVPSNGRPFPTRNEGERAPDVESAQGHPYHPAVGVVPAHHGPASGYLPQSGWAAEHRPASSAPGSSQAMGGNGNSFAPGARSCLAGGLQGFNHTVNFNTHSHYTHSPIYQQVEGTGIHYPGAGTGDYGPPSNGTMHGQGGGGLEGSSFSTPQQDNGIPPPDCSGSRYRTGRRHRGSCQDWSGVSPGGGISWGPPVVAVGRTPHRWVPGFKRLPSPPVSGRIRLYRGPPVEADVHGVGRRKAPAGLSAQDWFGQFAWHVQKEDPVPSWPVFASKDNLTMDEGVDDRGMGWTSYPPVGYELGEFGPPMGPDLSACGEARPGHSLGGRSGGLSKEGGPVLSTKPHFTGVEWEVNGMVGPGFCRGYKGSSDSTISSTQDGDCDEDDNNIRNDTSINRDKRSIRGVCNAGGGSKVGVASRQQCGGSQGPDLGSPSQARGPSALQKKSGVYFQGESSYTHALPPVGSPAPLRAGVGASCLGSTPWLEACRSALKSKVGALMGCPQGGAWGSGPPHPPPPSPASRPSSSSLFARCVCLPFGGNGGGAGHWALGCPHYPWGGCGGPHL